MTDSVQVFPPGFRLVDTAGTPYSGAYYELYEAGTDAPRLVYADQDLTVELGSTVYTDSAGYCVAAYGSSTKVLVYTGTDPYKVVAKDSAGVTIFTHDHVKGAGISGGGGGGASGITEAQADARYVRNPNALVAETAVDDTDIFGMWDTSASANVGVAWAQLKANLAAEGVVLASGTKCIFYQSSAPTGWTRDTSTSALNDAAIRIVTSGSGAGTTGGAGGFTSVFASRTITQANLPAVNLTGTAAAGGAHNHNMFVNSTSGSSLTGVSYPLVAGGSGDNAYSILGRGDVGPTLGLTDTASAHTHAVTVALGGSGTPLDFAVKHATFILCTKD